MDDHKVSVIGGAGFIGTRLCDRLFSSGVNFEIVDLKLSRSFSEYSKVGDVRSLESLRANITGNIVVNLAAVHRDDVRDKSEYFATNVEGARNVVDMSIEKGIRKIVFTSSVAVYGFAAADTDEHGKIDPFNEYGKTKFEAERRFAEWCSHEGGSLTIVRPTVVFGEGNRGNVYNLLRQIASDRFVMIGSGRNFKSMAYVENVAAFLEACIWDRRDFEVFNYIDKPDYDMETLVRSVNFELKGRDRLGFRIPYVAGLCVGKLADFGSYMLKKPLPVSTIRVRKFCSTTQFASSAAYPSSFVAPYTLHEGLKRTIHSEFIDPDPDREVFYTE